MDLSTNPKWWGGCVAFFILFFLALKKITYVDSVGNTVRDIENHFSRFHFCLYSQYRKINTWKIPSHQFSVRQIYANVHFIHLVLEVLDCAVKITFSRLHSSPAGILAAGCSVIKR